MAGEVELFVNVYERTWEAVVAPGWFDETARALRHDFALRTLVIGNCREPERVAERAEALRHSGEIDRWLFVDSEIDGALEQVGLATDALGRIAQYSSWAFAGVTRSGPEWICHFDPQLDIVRPGPWIGRSIAVMQGAARVQVASPSWNDPREPMSEALFVRDGFAHGYGFSDQLFLARRSFLSAPIYSDRCPASLRYPLIDMGWTFEARVDAYLRNHSMLRIVDLDAVYRHPEETGRDYPRRTLRERLRRLLRARALRRVDAVGQDPRTARVVRGG